MAENSPRWQMEAEYIQSCNCDYGCPCNFNALPTYGNCEALIAYHVRTGFFENTKLDDVTFAWGLWWPKAIHMGDGIGAVYVDSNATPEQVKAVDEITSGKYGGGVFTVFPSTLKTRIPIQAIKVEFHYHPYDGWFTVEGIGAAHSQHIRNARTDAPFEGELLLPNGIGFKRGTISSMKWFWKDKNISLNHERKNGHAAIARFSNEGCIG